MHCAIFHICAYSVAVTLYKKFMHGAKNVGKYIPNRFCGTYSYCWFTS